MREIIHFSDHELMADTFRSLCGAWRRARNWTTSRHVVTCAACLEMLRAMSAVTQPAAGSPLEDVGGLLPSREPRPGNKA